MKSYKLATDCYFPACIFKQFWISLRKWLSVLPHGYLNCTVRSIHFVIRQGSSDVSDDGRCISIVQTTRPETLTIFLIFVG